MNGLNGINGLDLNQYFDAYDDISVHQLMLEDKSRTLAYKNAIGKSLDLFINKTVMDVGAGTGILSIFCAMAGARKVYAVEASKLSKVTEQVVAENNYQDVIQVIGKKVEDIDPESIEKVDVIISEWMGMYLFHEGMLDSVIRARDMFLKEDGVMFPSVAKLYTAPCQFPSYYEFWDNVFGVSMKCVGAEFRKRKSQKLEITYIEQSEILGEEKMISWLDLKTTSTDELDRIGDENYVIVSKKSGRYQGACMWFVVEFPNGSELSTAPSAERTHWKQAIIVFPEDSEVSENQAIAFNLRLTRDESNPRLYNVQLSQLDAEKVDHEIPCSCDMTKCILTKAYIEQSSENSS